ncbi:OmpA family protein [Nocardiopsis nanhaiensis]
MAALAGVLLVISGCVVSGDEPSTGNGGNAEASPGEESPAEEAQDDAEAIASSFTTTTNLGADLQIDINSLDRLDSGMMKLDISIINDSDESFQLADALSQDGELGTASRISLIDASNQQLYLSQNRSDGSCFCESIDGDISPGESADLWVIYPQLEVDGVEAMTVTTPITSPFFDIPISDSSDSIESENLEEPDIRDLTMISDSLDEDDTGRSESGDEVSIILSSDVLFDTESADLRTESEDILEQVAQEIDDATSPTVSIDGHADNTGNDSINIPLSEERAEAVESVISDLVNRDDVSFETEGHGSADPIADNDTEEGKQRNRRVSVTFEI